MTSVKTVLTYWDTDQISARRTAVAAELAQSFDAHLSVVAFGYEPDIPPYAFGGVAPQAMMEFYGQAQAEAEGLAKEAQKAIEAAGVRGDARALVSTYSGLDLAFGEAARFADLVVLSQPYDSPFEAAALPLLEGALFDGDGAVMVLPYGETPVPGRRAMIGWDKSREALRAVRRSLPILARAEAVEIAMVEPGREEETPGEELALWLSRHGIAAEITLLPLTTPTIADGLIQHATDTGADLMVTGGYGHSRFRQMMVGGVTRELLRRAPVPVLMAH